jgi:hypothetical protein
MPLKKAAAAEVAWWDEPYPHPMSDEQFADNWCARVFMLTTDRDIARVRARVWYFIHHHMKQEMEDALRGYRTAHPLELPA